MKSVKTLTGLNTKMKSSSWMPVSVSEDDLLGIDYVIPDYFIS